MYAYHFSGYWKDVGTISLFVGGKWKSSIRNAAESTCLTMIGRFTAETAEKQAIRSTETAVVENCMITDGCRIAGHVKRSILFSGVKVAEGAEVEDAVIMGGTVIESGAVVKHCIVAENVVIGQNAVVGEMPHDGEKVLPPSDPESISVSVPK